MKRAISSNDGAVPEGFGAKQNGKPGAGSGFFGEKEGTSAGRVRIWVSMSEVRGMSDGGCGMADVRRMSDGGCWMADVGGSAERDADGTDGSDEVLELTGVWGVLWFS